MQKTFTGQNTYKVFHIRFVKWVFLLKGFKLNPLLLGMRGDVFVDITPLLEAYIFSN